MNKTNFSPGPWKVEYNEAIYAAESTYGAPDFRVADVHGEDTLQRKANANLIAAAPELLAALQKLESWLTHPKLAGNIATKAVELGFAADLRLSLCQARAALAKAGGGL